MAIDVRKKKKAVAEVVPAKKKKKAVVEAAPVKKSKKGAEKTTAKSTKVAAKSKKTSTRTARAKKEVEYFPNKEKFNKTSLVNYLMENETAPSKKQVQGVLTDLENLMTGSVHKKGIGTFMWPGVFKIVTKQIPARKMPAIKGGEKKPNPFKPGEFTITKARKAFVKPATVRVKIRPMKKLKDAAIA